MFLGGFGFFTGGGAGGSIVSVVDIRQARAAAAPSTIVAGTATYTPSPAIRGNSVTVFVNGGDYLENDVDFEFDTSGGYVTEIRLLLGRLFNTGEFWTITGTLS